MVLWNNKVGFRPERSISSKRMALRPAPSLQEINSGTAATKRLSLIVAFIAPPVANIVTSFGILTAVLLGGFALAKLDPPSNDQIKSDVTGVSESPTTRALP